MRYFLAFFMLTVIMAVPVGAETVSLYEGRLSMQLPEGISGPLLPVESGTDHAYSDRANSLALAIQFYPAMEHPNTKAFAGVVNDGLSKGYDGTFEVTREKAQRIGGQSFWVVEGGYSKNGVAHRTLGLFWLGDAEGLLILYACTEKNYPALKSGIFESKSSVRWEG